MKTIKTLTLCFSILLIACKPMKQLAQGRPDYTAETMSNAAPLPSGNYFIVNADELALTPWQPTAAQNVFLQPFNHGGMQQWHITRIGNSNSYNIKLVGSEGMFFQPNYVKDHTPMISPDKSSIIFRVQPATTGQQYWLIKCLKYNGDAMHSYIYSPNLPTELRFDPSDGSKRFLWRFIRVKE